MLDPPLVFREASKRSSRRTRNSLNPFGGPSSLLRSQITFFCVLAMGTLFLVGIRRAIRPAVPSSSLEHTLTAISINGELI